MHSKVEAWDGKSVNEYRKWLQEIGDDASIEELEGMHITTLSNFRVAAALPVSYSHVL